MGGEIRCDLAGCEMTFCPPPEEYQDLLPEQPVTYPTQEQQLEGKLNEGFESYVNHLWSCSFYTTDEKGNSKEVFDIKGCRKGIIQALTVATIDGEKENRRKAIESLLHIQNTPQAREIIEDISKSHPFPSLSEMATRILGVPELPRECDITICPEENIFGNLAREPVLDTVQQQQLEAISENGDLEFCRRIDGPQRVFLEDPKTNCRTGIIHALKTSLTAKGDLDRNRATEVLLKIRRIPGVKEILEGLTHSHPIAVIMERAAQIMAAPELPDRCDPLTKGLWEEMHTFRCSVYGWTFLH